MCSRNIGLSSVSGFELGTPEIVRICKMRGYNLGGAETKQRSKDRNESVSAVIKLAAAYAGAVSGQRKPGKRWQAPGKA